MLNPSARRTVFPLTLRHNVATQIMFAVRRALSQPAVLGEVVEKLIAGGEVDANEVDRDDPLGFVAAHPEVESIVEAAYRFCRHERGTNVILTGTGNVTHLEENVRSILAPPLPEELLERLGTIFGNVDSVSGN